MLVQRPSIVPAMTPVVKKALQKRNKYGKIWGLARETTLLAVDDNDSEIVDILQSYIQRKKNEKNTNISNTQSNNKKKPPL